MMLSASLTSLNVDSLNQLRSRCFAANASARAAASVAATTSAALAATAAGAVGFREDAEGISAMF